MDQPAPTLAQTVARMKTELLALVAQGVVPRECRSFGELDEYIDQNSLGGFCNDELMDELAQHFGGNNSEHEWPDALTAFINAAQDAVNSWIESDGLLSPGVGVRWGSAATIAASAPGEVSAGAAGQIIFISNFESRNFSFSGLGKTEEGAREAMRAGLVKHSKRMDLAPDWWTDDDIRVFPCPVGGCVRDGELLMQPEPRRVLPGHPDPILAALTRSSSWTVEQQAQFSDWFATSMVHDGLPRVLYRGAADTIEPFKPTLGDFGIGIYLTDDSSFAEKMAKDAQTREGGVAMVVPIFTHMAKPYVFTINEGRQGAIAPLLQALKLGDSAVVGGDLIDPLGSPAIQLTLVAGGYDGLIVRSRDGDDFIAFDAGQILELPRGHQAVIDSLTLEAKQLSRMRGFDSVAVADPTLTKTYIGPIVAQTAAYFIQSVGRSTAVIHDKQKFQVEPELGRPLDISYAGGQVALGSTPHRVKER